MRFRSIISRLPGFLRARAEATSTKNSAGSWLGCCAGRHHARLGEPHVKVDAVVAANADNKGGDDDNEFDINASNDWPGAIPIW